MTDERSERFRRLREAGFDSSTALYARTSELRTNALLRRRKAGKSAVRASEEVNEKDETQLRAENIVESPSAKRLRAGDAATKDAQWSRWSSPNEGFPRTITRIAEVFRGELKRQGRSDSEIEPRLYGLVWEWFHGHFEYDDLVNDADVFDEY